MAKNNGIGLTLSEAACACGVLGIHRWFSRSSFDVGRFADAAFCLRRELPRPEDTVSQHGVDQLMGHGTCIDRTRSRVFQHNGKRNARPVGGNEAGKPGMVFFAWAHLGGSRFAGNADLFVADPFVTGSFSMGDNQAKTHGNAFERG